jgi:hypothetical protein
MSFKTNDARTGIECDSTLRWMQIDFNEQYEKHMSSIRVSRDSASNVVDCRFPQKKSRLSWDFPHFGECRSNLRNNSWSTCFRFESVEIDSQMWRIEANFLRSDHGHENMICPGFQHFEEYRSIGPDTKHNIQCLSTAMCIDPNSQWKVHQHLREILAYRSLSAFHKFPISIGTFAMPMKFTSGSRAPLIIRTLPFRQSANEGGTWDWGERKFMTSIDGFLLSIILTRILCFYCVIFHFAQLLFLLKLSELTQRQIFIICAAFSVLNVIMFVACCM